MNPLINNLLRFISVVLLILSIGSCAEQKSEELKSSDLWLITWTLRQIYYGFM